VGKAREIYSALPVEQSSQYTVVKEAVFKAYELVPEAYRQKFRTSVREDKQTYVEFARIKERLFDRWCASQNTNGEYAKLRELKNSRAACHQRSKHIWMSRRWRHFREQLLWQMITVMEKEPVGADVKLKNSDVLANIQAKLGHLSGEERGSMTRLINEF